MPEHRCEHCGFKGKFDDNPTSFIGRLWRWHIAWCPGWKKYMESLTEQEKIGIIDKYGTPRFFNR